MLRRHPSLEQNRRCYQCLLWSISLRKHNSRADPPPAFNSARYRSLSPRCCAAPVSRSYGREIRQKRPMAWGSDYSEAEDVRANNPSDAPTQVARSTLDDLFVGERQGNHINGVRPMAAYVHRVRLAQLQIAGQATQKVILRQVVHPRVEALRIQTASVGRRRLPIHGSEPHLRQVERDPQWGKLLPQVSRVVSQIGIGGFDQGGK